MKKLPSSDLANLPETAGAMTIIISRKYLGLQLRSNTAAAQAASLQAITNSSSTSMLAVVESGEPADVRLKGGRDPSRLSIAVGS